MILQQYAYGCVEGSGCDVPWFAHQDLVLGLITCFVIIPIVVFFTPELMGSISLFPWIHFTGFAVFIVASLFVQGPVGEVAGRTFVWDVGGRLTLWQRWQ